MDILEPHDPTRIDNLGKAKGFAEYARQNPGVGRIQLIRKGKAHVENSKLVVHDDVTDEEIKAIRAELGDCFWQLNGICSVFGWNANSICQENLDKLASRKDRGKIDGNGDFR